MHRSPLRVNQLAHFLTFSRARPAEPADYCTALNNVIHQTFTFVT